MFALHRRAFHIGEKTWTTVQETETGAYMDIGRDEMEIINTKKYADRIMKILLEVSAIHSELECYLDVIETIDNAISPDDDCKEKSPKDKYLNALYEKLKFGEVFCCKEELYGVLDSLKQALIYLDFGEDIPQFPKKE